MIKKFIFLTLFLPKIEFFLQISKNFKIFFFK